MRRRWRYQKKILYTQYCPKSQLVLPRTELSRPSLPVIDAHVHFGSRKAGECFEKRYDEQEVVQRLRELGVCHCVDLTLFNRENWERVQEKTRDVSEFVDYCAPIDLSGAGTPGYDAWIAREMERYAAEGAVGFKLWKELGMSVRGRDGGLMSLDAPELDVIWEEAKRLDKPLVMHVADPPAFFEKADEQNERLEQLRRFPFWQHYGKEYTFEGLMEGLERLLERRKKNRFLIAHCCSLASDLCRLERLLSEHDNLWTDVAAVLSELGRQPKQFRGLLERHPERFLFGTDYFCDPLLPHRPYFRFLETEDECFPYDESGSLEHGRWNIYGCGLEHGLLRKLYFENAAAFFDLRVCREEPEAGGKNSEKDRM